MSISEMFQAFLDNLKIDNADQISLRYEEITSCLNKRFRETDSKTANSLQVGSYGRWTAIKGISDLDMLYIMPQGKWAHYKDNNQYQLLTDTKDAIKTRYPNTEIYVDRLVVRVLYNDFHIEVQPVFEQEDGSFKYPDTYNGGLWKITKPREEISAMKEFVDTKNKNLRRLSKMIRAWKNKHGFNIGGLLIDTLAHNFLRDTNAYDDKSYLYYDWLSRDFFKYLAEQPIQDHYKALGSGQNVKVKKKFQKIAKQTYEMCLVAIEAKDSAGANDLWRKVYGRNFPLHSVSIRERHSFFAHSWKNTEEFIEDKYPVDIRYDLTLDCDVSQDGFRVNSLTQMLAKRFPLRPNKKLLFRVVNIDVPEAYTIEWKILNRGEEAQRRNCIRGAIVKDEGRKEKKESTDFRGEHIVECYAIRNGVVVARDHIQVPIEDNSL